MRKKKDSKLIQLAQAGDRAAFDRLMGDCCDRLEAALKWRFRGRDLWQKIELADLLQETAFMAFRSVWSFEGRDDDSFFLWLKGIGENIFLHWGREYRRDGYLPLLCDLSPSQLRRRRLRFERVQRLFQGMNADEREVFLSARIEGLSMEEIGKRIGRCRSAVMMLMSRALQKLQDSSRET